MLAKRSAKSCTVRFRAMCLWKSAINADGVCSTLLVAPCLLFARLLRTDQALKDFFIQGGQQVLDDSHLKITSLRKGEEIAQTGSSLTCRYLMELSDHSKRWVRFTYSLDEAGQAAIDYEEEAKSTSQ